jgi:hypothetical protein
MEKEKLLAMLETKHSEAVDMASSSVGREWWRGYAAALYWIKTQVYKETV